MQLRERIILNSEIADVNSNFNSAVEASLLGLERLGMSRVLRPGGGLPYETDGDARRKL